jgi:hypothetical protein
MFHERKRPAARNSSMGITIAKYSHICARKIRAPHITGGPCALSSHGIAMKPAIEQISAPQEPTKKQALR